MKRKHQSYGNWLALACGCAMAISTAAEAARSKVDDPEKAADVRDKIVCKRFVRTGSLADTYRTCKTKAEWERERENLRQLNPIDSCANRANGGGCGPS